jgi:hypothetical protein
MRSPVPGPRSSPSLIVPFFPELCTGAIGRPSGRYPAGQSGCLMEGTGGYCGGMDNEQAFPVIRQTVLDTADPRRLTSTSRTSGRSRSAPGC